MKKLSALILLAVSAALLGAEKLPEELAKLPKDNLIDASHKIHGRIKKADKEAFNGKAAVQVPDEKKAKKNFFNGGVSCQKLYREQKKVVAYKAWKSFPKDEKYHWYKIPNHGSSNGKIEEKAHIYLGNWRSGCYLHDYKGNFEYWVSLKFQGPFYVEGSQKENGVYLDRVILVKK